jgi:uncharacterized protein
MSAGRFRFMQQHRSFRVPIVPVVAAASAFLAAAVIVIAVRPPVAGAAVAAADADLRSTVTVLGDGRVLVQPDVANVSLGVEATAPTQEAAQADAATRMQAVVDTLVAQGVAREDIRTNRLSAHPVYDQQDRSVIRGYQASNSVRAKLRNLDQVGAIVDAVTAAGANRVDGISFAVDQIEVPKGQARGLAMQNARAKADQLASLAGLRVVSVKSIQESDPSSNPPRPQPARADSFGTAAAPPPVEPGTQEVGTQVTVTYIVE